MMHRMLTEPAQFHGPGFAEGHKALASDQPVEVGGRREYTSGDVGQAADHPGVPVQGVGTR